MTTTAANAPFEIGLRSFPAIPYFNAFARALYSLPGLHGEMSVLPPPPLLNNPSSGLAMVAQFNQLFARMSDTTSRAIDTEAAARSVVVTAQVPVAQSSAENYIKTFFSLLKSAFGVVDGDGEKFRRLFEGSALHLVTVKGMPPQNPQQRGFSPIVLPAGQTSFARSMEQFFLSTETKTGPDGSAVEITTNVIVRSVPSYFVVLLTRSSPSAAGDPSFPSRLSLRDYSPVASPDAYRLQAAVMRVGAGEAEHYAAYVREGMGWARCIDEEVSAFSVDEGQPTLMIKDSVPYVLFYEREKSACRSSSKRSTSPGSRSGSQTRKSGGSSPSQRRKRGSGTGSSQREGSSGTDSAVSERLAGSSASAHAPRPRLPSPHSPGPGPSSKHSSKSGHASRPRPSSTHSGKSAQSGRSVHDEVQGEMKAIVDRVENEMAEALASPHSGPPRLHSYRLFLADTTARERRVLYTILFQYHMSKSRLLWEEAQGSPRGGTTASEILSELQGKRGMAVDAQSVGEAKERFEEYKHLAVRALTFSELSPSAVPGLYEQMLDWLLQSARADSAADKALLVRTGQDAVKKSLSALMADASSPQALQFCTAMTAYVGRVQQKFGGAAGALGQLAEMCPSSSQAAARPGAASWHALRKAIKAGQRPLSDAIDEIEAMNMVHALDMRPSLQLRLLAAYNDYHALSPPLQDGSLA